MPVVDLTSSFVRAATCPEGPEKVDFFDSQQKGFLLEVRASGRKTYYQRFRDERGRERQFKIGRADIVTIDQARRKGRSVFARAILGDDPQQRREELRAIPTLEAFVRDRYIPFVATYKRSWRTDQAILRHHALPQLGRMALDEIKAEHIVDVVARMKARDLAASTSNRVLVIIRYIYNLAIKWRVPGITSNPTTGIELGPEIQRNRFLTKDEVQTLSASIASDENRTAADAIMLLLLTGARRNEVTHARWEDVFWDDRKLRVPMSKSGKPRWISLSASAIELLRSIPRSDGSAYVFPAPTTGRPSPSLWFPWKRIRDRAGLGDVRLHDLRHSFASFLVNEGISLYVVQGLLGHANARTTQRYAHLQADTLARATDVVDAIVMPQGR
ncbi:MAG: tyrosine-type recombinase/integrase [Pseudolabrys sp.]